MGADLCPTVCSFFKMVKKKVNNSTVEAALKVGKVPHIEEVCERMVEKFREKQEVLKKNK